MIRNGHKHFLKVDTGYGASQKLWYLPRLSEKFCPPPFFFFAYSKVFLNNLKTIPMMLEETKFIRKLRNDVYIEANKNMCWARLTEEKVIASSRLR